ncbi:MAG: hypothetical protein ACRENE_20640, partial [Polyangiaceae bacterium]
MRKVGQGWALVSVASTTSVAVAGVFALGGAAVAACGGAGQAGAQMQTGAHAKGLDHEDCSAGGHKVEALDTNSDGKEDIRRVMDSGGHVLCAVADLNHDGKADLYEFFDASGNVRRREFCYDDMGVVNAVEYYEVGKLARREYDTSGQNTIDTWDWFDPSTPTDAKTGRPVHPVRRERATRGDGRVDQWWAWDGNNVTIAVDHDGDGKPDPASAVTLGPDNSLVTPPAPGSAPGAPPGDGGAPASATSAAPAASSSTPPVGSAGAGSAADGGK